MTQFKVGDRVKLTEIGGGWFWGNVGKEGVIIPNEQEDFWTNVKFDNSGGAMFEIDFGNPDRLEPVTTTPPATIQHEGYNYTRGEPVVPEWVKDGAWVVRVSDGSLAKIMERPDGKYAIMHRFSIPVTVEKNSIANDFRPHTPEDYKWGDWAMYEGKKVFVMGKASENKLVAVSFPNADGHDDTMGSHQWDYARISDLTPTFTP